MTASLREGRRPPGPHTARLRRWGAWLGWLLLTGHLIFSHGCHGADEDNELCARPHAPGERGVLTPR